MDRLNTSFSAKTAARRYDAGSALRSVNLGRSQIDDIGSFLPKQWHLIGPEYAFTQKITSGELHIVARSPHGHTQWFPCDSDFERLFYGKFVSGLFGKVIAVLKAEDASSRNIEIHNRSTLTIAL